jgi:predicted dehydrogenase
MGRIRAQAIRASQRAEVVHVADPTPGAMPETVLGSHTANTVITDPRVDAIFVCTPNYLNKPLTIAALEAGKHVFCEKPPAFTAGDVEEIRAAEAKSGKCLKYGFNHRHHESIVRAKQVVDSGELGKILWMRGRYGKSVDKNFFKNWRSHKELAGGGILLDQGIHMLDLFLHFSGEFDEVQAIVSNLFWKIEGIEDNVFANFRNSKSGVTASLHSTMTQWRHLFSLEIFLEKGHIVLNGLKTSSNTYGEEVLTIAKNNAFPPEVVWDEDQVFQYSTDNSWASEIADFFDAVEGNHPVRLGNSHDALVLMRVVDQIYRQSPQAQRPVCPPQPTPAPVQQI